MQIISIANQKGGVGKSTTALALSAALSKKNYKVLLVDLDPQGNLSESIIIKNKARSNIIEVLRDSTSPSNINFSIINNCISTAQYCDIILSTPSLIGADTTITQIGKEQRLKEALAKITTKYDYCLIDTPPALNILNVNAFAATNKIIIPAQADLYSLQGIFQLYSTIEMVRKYCNPSLDILGILLTRYNARSIITKSMTQNMQEMAKAIGTKLLNTKIRECTAIKEAQALKQSIFDYSPNCNASKDYNTLIEEIL